MAPSEMSIVRTESSENHGKQSDGNPEREYRVGRWTAEEHKTFLAGLKLHGKNWKKISLIVKTRSSVQTRTHAQKYFLKHSKDVLKDKETHKKDNSKPVAKSETQQRKRTFTDSLNLKKTKKTKTIDKVEKIDVFNDGRLIFDLGSSFDESMHTPRTTNGMVNPPVAELPKFIQATTKDTIKPSKYARSLDLDVDPLLFQTFPTKNKTHQADFRITAPYELDYLNDDPLTRMNSQELLVDMFNNELLF